jgi:hypothetical protein
VVEHLLAKEDVASSSLVTRSSLRSNMAKAKARASAPRLGISPRILHLLDAKPQLPSSII